MYIEGQQKYTRMIEPNVITVTEAARQKDCTRQAVYNAIKRGDLNTTHLGSQTVIVKDKTYAGFNVQQFGGRLHKQYQSKRQGGQ